MENIKKGLEKVMESPRILKDQKKTNLMTNATSMSLKANSITAVFVCFQESINSTTKLEDVVKTEEQVCIKSNIH